MTFTHWLAGLNSKARRRTRSPREFFTSSSLAAHVEPFESRVMLTGPFDGSYVGSYAGTVTFTDPDTDERETFTIEELGDDPSIFASITDNKLVVNVPSIEGTGTTTVSSNGGLTVTANGFLFGFEDIAVRYTGTLRNSGGVITGSGTWTASGAGITGSGTWNLSKVLVTEFDGHYTGSFDFDDPGGTAAGFITNNDIDVTIRNGFITVVLPGVGNATGTGFLFPGGEFSVSPRGSLNIGGSNQNITVVYSGSLTANGLIADGSGEFTITSPSSVAGEGGTWQIERDAATERLVTLPAGGGTYDVFADGGDVVVKRQVTNTELFRAARGQVLSMTVQGSAGDDNVIFHTDDVLTFEEQTFDFDGGGNGANGDSLKLVSALFWDSVTSTFTGPTDGTVESAFDDFTIEDLVSRQSFVTFTNVERLQDEQRAPFRDIVTETAMNQTVTISDDGNAKNGLMQMTSPGAAPLHLFRVPNVATEIPFLELAISLGSGGDVVQLTTADDALTADVSFDVFGGAGNDSITGSSRADSLFGDEGDDTIRGGMGDDLLRDGAGADDIFGEDGNDTVEADGGTDELNGGDGADLLDVETETDVTLSDTQLVFGADPANTISGFEMASIVDVTFTTTPAALEFNASQFTGSATLSGDSGDDSLTGGSGSDLLFGGEEMMGGGGDDVINIFTTFTEAQGGLGNDTLVLEGGVTDMTFDLTTLDNTVFTGFENIDLLTFNTGLGDVLTSLTLDVSEVLNLSTETNTLIVRREFGNTVDIGPGWTQGSNETIAGRTFEVFTQNDATLKVQVQAVEVSVGVVSTDGIRDADAFREDVPLEIDEGDVGVEDDVVVGGVFSFVFTRADGTGPLTVNFSVGGTAVFNSDYTVSGAASFSATSGTVTFADGETEATILVDPKSDAAFERSESVILTVTSGTGYVPRTSIEEFGSNSEAEVHILNDDAPSDVLVNVAVTSPANGMAAEDGSPNLVYTFTRTGATTSALTVTFEVGGTATFGPVANASTDFTFLSGPTVTTVGGITTGTVVIPAGQTSVTITADPKADTLFESNETVVISVSGTATHGPGDNGEATGTITNDEPTISLAVTPTSVGEDGVPNLVYTFTRATGSTTAAVTVNYTVGRVDTTGLATFNTDYKQTGGTFAVTAGQTTGTGTIVIGAGKTSATLTIDPQADVTLESNEQVVIKLAAGNNYGIVTTGEVVGTILDDDSTVSVAVSPAAVVEDSPDTLLYTFTRAGVTDVPLTVNFLVGGTASTSDFSVNDADSFSTVTKTGTVTFEANETTVSVEVGATDDALTEIDETVIVNVASGAGYKIGNPSAATGTITNDEPPNIFVEDDVLIFEDLGGRADRLVLSVAAFNSVSNLVIKDANNVLLTSVGTNISANEVRIPLPTLATMGVTILALSLGGGDDGADLKALPATFPLSIEVDGDNGNDTLTAGAAAADLTGGAGDDSLTGGAGADFLSGGAGNDKITGGGGIDTLVESGDHDFKLENAKLTVLLSMTPVFTDTLATVEQALLTGGDSANRLDASLFKLGPVTLRGGDGNDVLLGGEKNDSLNGEDGNDSVSGNAGDDLVQGDEGNDTVSGGLGVDNVNGGDDTDTVSETAVAAAVNLTLANTLLTGQGNDTLAEIEAGLLIGSTGKNALNASAFTLGGVTLMGRDGDDTLTGSGQADALDGGAGNDLLNGGAGNDTVTGGLGNDLLNGEADNDQLFETGDVNFTLTATTLTGLGNDTFSNIEHAILEGGAGANTLIVNGFTSPATVRGGAGNDTLTAMNSNSVLEGGEGDDVLSAPGDNLLNGGNGTDTVVHSGRANYTLTDTQLTAVGTVTLMSIEQARLTLDNTGGTIDASAFTGQATLTGGTANDTLTGGDGNDVLSGGAGDDQLNGGDGTDTVSETADANFALTNDSLTGAGTDALSNIEQASLTGGAGANTLNASAFTLGPVTLNGAGGNDTLTGTANADVLLGGDANDSLVGGEGNDSLSGQLGNDSLEGGGGTDRLVEFTTVNLTLNATQLIGAGTGNLGTDNYTSIEEAFLSGEISTVPTIANKANIFDATLFGGAVTLNGLGGNDKLFGGSGSDSINGGDGNDSVIGNGGNDNISGGAGVDTAFGNAGEDVITGGDGNDNLDGGADDDLLFGDAGNDKLFGQAGDDTLRGGAGLDTLEGGLDDDLLAGEADKDKLLGGLGSDTLGGGDGDDSLNGNGGPASMVIEGVTVFDSADSLLGQAGKDTLKGGDGDDLLLAGDDLLKDSLDGEGGTGDRFFGVTVGAAATTDTIVKLATELIDASFANLVDFDALLGD